ncbi:MAG: DUF4340 domain-containing protein [Polyangiaceae bacterium]|nr:DUF4340 domain-containing protein [Polyangiaceae bacterium]
MNVERFRRRLADLALFVLAVVAVGTMVITRRSVTTAEAEARQRHVLGAFRAADLSRIVIERGEDRIVLERPVGRGADEASGEEGTDGEEALRGDDGFDEAGSDGDWRLVEPREEQAGVFQVRSLLDVLERAVFLRRIAPEAVDRARFGLETPRAVVSLAMGALSYRLLLGGEAVSPPGAAYLEVTGDGVPNRGVGIVRQATASALSIGIEDLREPTLAPYGSNQLKRLVVERAGERVELERVARRWRVVEAGGKWLADRPTMDAVFVQLVRLDAETSIPVDEARRLVDAAPAVRLELVPVGTAPPARLELGGHCPRGDGMVALRVTPAPLAGCVPADIAAVFGLPRDHWRSRAAFGMHPDEVESVLIERGSQRLDLVRHEAAFRLRAPRTAEVDIEAGNRRILALVDARGEPVEVPDLARVGLAPPLGTAILSSAAATEAEVVTEVLEVGRPDADGRVHVRRRLDGVVLRLDRESARAVYPDSTLLRPREIFTFAGASVRRVEMSGAVAQTLVQLRPGAFALERPLGFEVDGGLAADLVDRLGKLEADRWVADADDGSFGLAEPALRFRLVVEGEGGKTGERELRVGDLTTGGAFASVDGDTGVFVLPRRELLGCERLLIDRRLVPTDPSSLTEIVIDAPTASIVLVRLGAGFEQTGGAPRLSAPELVRLSEALADLRAEAALHVGPEHPGEGFSSPQLTLRLRSDQSGAASSRTIRFGAGDAWQGQSILFARVEGVDATFAVARGLVGPILELW